jgi:hypothetical protein
LFSLRIFAALRLCVKKGNPRFARFAAGQTPWITAEASL